MKCQTMEQMAIAKIAEKDAEIKRLAEEAESRERRLREMEGRVQQEAEATEAARQAALLAKREQEQIQE